ncbi:hypothetical protein C1H57_08155 [Clostridium sp. 2-1]|uniref:hypothetical protein n=1 Tax=Clostridium TaxID=1485 RepID=UPI000CDB3DAE|nr:MULTISPECIES: hypothetical protein [Clostridium]MBN7575379.1 hypothetical protein [Clostridium beijerinckii]MBN7580690.1 hypothetical protein [Clostridium beijerinckii]MBN7585143.1 hypothetical protein [Clostridium beijerinckii]MBO0522527.1 hypothetical protein [Clostridium beijerinckii]POO91785.1 hypothetical protein C1H57_08155 [Clostridium sp. 2-1]
MLKQYLLTKFNKANKSNELVDYIEARGGVGIAAHPFYEWVENNIDKINYTLLKAIITNIVPLGADGRKFYELIIYKRNSFQNEFLNLYDRLSNLYINGELKISSYLELRYLGYTGQRLKKKCPADDVLGQYNKCYENS